jgi:hypothetical protein
MNVLQLLAAKEQVRARAEQTREPCPALEFRNAVEIFPRFTEAITYSIHKIQSEISGDELQILRRGFPMVLSLLNHA